MVRGLFFAGGRYSGSVPEFRWRQFLFGGGEKALLDRIPCQFAVGFVRTSTSGFAAVAARRSALPTPHRTVSKPRSPFPARAGVAFSSSRLSSMALRHIPAQSLHLSTPTWWLESRFHFSFAEYYSPKNLQFGVLRVLNDDLVKGRAGFGTHPHKDMEIVTYVVDGKLTHKDSMGTLESLGRGSVQYLSAGTGITHSEMNNDDQLLRFLQIWIVPKARGLTPNYGSRVWRKEDRHNKLQHLVTDFANFEDSEDTHAGVIPIHQDANFYASEADPNLSQTFILRRRRQAYLVNIEGNLSVNGTQLSARDAIEIRGSKADETEVKLIADGEKGAHFLLIEMPQA